jgi:hypothetical protein
MLLSVLPPVATGLDQLQRLAEQHTSCWPRAPTNSALRGCSCAPRLGGVWPHMASCARACAYTATIRVLRPPALCCGALTR